MQSKNSKISIKVERELQTFYFLEHPGFGSDKGLLSSLEGNILEAFKQRQQLKLKTKNSFVESHYEASANCLLKITKAKDQITYTIIGVVVKTIKFRDLFDFSVKLRTDDPLHNLATIMKETDVHRMFKYRYEPSKDNILVPPPSMCRLPFSLDYNMFKENTFIPADGNNADGTTERRVGQRRKIRNEFGAILLDGNAEDIPNRPPEKIPNLDEESNIATKNRAYKNIKVCRILRIIIYVILLRLDYTCLNAY